MNGQQNNDTELPLSSYFERKAKIILTHYELSKEQFSSANLGINREYICNEYFSNFLPSSLIIRKGEIIDHKGKHSSQQDLIIMRDDSPVFTIGEADIFPVEGVFSVIEVKSNLSTRSLKRAIKQLNTVKDLEITYTGASMHMKEMPPIYRPLRCVFAYEGATLKTLYAVLENDDNKEIIDIICVLKRGIIYNEALFKNDTEKRFKIKEGKSEALTLFSYYLHHFGSSFMARSFVLTSYFDPWINNSRVRARARTISQ